MAEGEEEESWMFHDPLYGIISFQVVKAKMDNIKFQIVWPHGSTEVWCVCRNTSNMIGQLTK